MPANLDLFRLFINYCDYTLLRSIFFKDLNWLLLDLANGRA